MTWEYRDLKMTSGYFSFQLDDLGKEGWEVYHVIEMRNVYSPMCEPELTFLLKRPIETGGVQR